MLDNFEGYHDNRFYELETWKEIISSPGWDFFRELLARHKEYLEKQVLISVGCNDISGAQKSLAKAEECTKLLSLVDERLAFLRKELNKGE